MSDLPAPGEVKAGTGPVLTGARGVQVGDGNFQVNYHIVQPGDRLTAADGMIRPPLVSSSGTVESPYRGLGAFGERDAPFFHGREAATREILGLMSDAAQGAGLLVVSGVSGAGKSSLLRAGVLPRIRGEGLASVPGAARWTALLLTPTREPLEQLALQAAGMLGTDAAGMHANLASHPDGFATTARQLALRSAPPDGEGAGRVLLVVDQFEQVFTQCTDEEQRRTFVTALHAAAATGTALVVIAVRADFEARCADFPALAPAVRNHRYLVTAMDEVELRIAIADPVATLAASSGQPLLVEAPLVDYLVREMLEAPGLPTSGAGALPLLSHALDQAWRSRSGPVLTLADYQRGGGIQGAVAVSADRVFESLTPPRRDVARQVFLRLTTTGDDGTVARDRVPRDELLKAAGPGRDGDVAGVLDAFTGARLITQAAEDVEVSHDALLTAWPLLRDEWLAGSRADLAVLSRLRDTARKWAAGGMKPGLLYRDEVLDEAAGAVGRMAAASGQPLALSPGEEDFLRASVQVRRNAARRRAVIRYGAVAVTICLAAAVAVTSVSLVSANQDLNTANIQRLSAVSAALRDSDPAVSALAAADAWHLDSSSQTRDVAIEAASNALTGEFDAAPGTVAVSPDGSVLAVSDPWSEPVAGATGSSELTLWSMARRELLGHISFPDGTNVSSVAFSPVEHDHAATLAATTANGVVLYQVSGSSYRKSQTLRAGGTGGTVQAPIAFGDDGTLAVSATADGGDIWLFAGGGGRYPSRPTDVIRNSGAVDSLSFASDGSLAVGTSSGVSVYRPAGGYTGRPAHLREKAGNPATCARFGTGGFLTVTSGSGTAVDRYSAGTLTGVPLWSQTGQDSGAEVEDGAEVASGTEGVALEGAALSPRGVLAVAEDDGLHLYVAGHAAAGFIDVATLPYPGQQKPDEVDVAFTPDGNSLVENVAGQVRVYDTRLLTGTSHMITSAQVIPIAGVGQADSGLDVDPADTAMVAIARPAAVQLVNVTNGRAAALPGTAGAIWVSFAPDGALAVVTSDYHVRLFPDPRTAPARSRLVVRTGAVTRVAFSPAGAMAVTEADGPGLTVYPPGNFSAGTVLTPRTPGASAAGAEDPVFGPDGKLAVVAGVNPPSGVAVFSPGKSGKYSQQAYIPDGTIGLALTERVIAFAPDGTLAIGTRTGIQVYRPDSYRNPKIITGTGNPGETGYEWLAFTRGGILVSASKSTAVSLWDPATGLNLATFDVAMHEGLFGTLLAVSPDGKYLVLQAGIAARSASGQVSGAEVTTIWSAPYLDGDAADGVRALCGQLAGAPDPREWQQQSLTSGLPYPRVCG
jgi:WD40 repeat protein